MNKEKVSNESQGKLFNSLGTIKKELSFDLGAVSGTSDNFHDAEVILDFSK